MQTIFPLTRDANSAVCTVACTPVQHLLVCQLRMVPDPVKTWTTPLPTHSKCCLRHRPSHWCRCKIVVKMWGNLSIVIIASENTPQNYTVVLYNFVIVRFLPLVTINFEVSIRQWRVRVNEKTMNHNETLFTCRQWHDISYHSFEEEVINIKTKWAAAAQSLKDFERIQYLGMNCGRTPTPPPASPACFIIRNRRSISSGKGQRWVNMHIL